MLQRQEELVVDTNECHQYGITVPVKHFWPLMEAWADFRVTRSEAKIIKATMTRLDIHHHDQKGNRGYIPYHIYKSAFRKVTKRTRRCARMTNCGGFRPPTKITNISLKGKLLKERRKLKREQQRKDEWEVRLAAEGRLVVID